MFSSLLPKPKHSHHTRKIVLPTLAPQSNKLILPTEKTNDQLVVVHENTNALLHLADDGSLDYTRSVLTASGLDKKAQASYDDTIPLKKRYPNLRHHFPRYTLQNCPDDSLKVCLELTKKVVDKLIAQQEGLETSDDENDSQLFTDGERGRRIEVVNYQEDPMAPPKFKLRKNRHKEPSPPPPILKKPPTEKVTKEIKDKWSIPSVVSNWKNNNGFAISLGKRTEAASGGLAAPKAELNVENFAELSLALENADQQAREEIKIRNEQRRALAAQEQQRKEMELKDLVERTRNSRRGHKRSDDSNMEHESKRRRA